QITEGSARNVRLDRLDESVLDFACVPLPDGGCLVSYVDVTDTVRVQRALEERNIALEMADQVKTEFIANVSYELRTPLNTISGFTDVLDGELFGTLNPRQKEYVSGIVIASRQLTELIDDILDLATIEAGYMALDLQSIRIEQILANVRDRAKEKIESGRLTLEIDCSPDVGAARVDEMRMTKALFNLLWNSIMFQSDEDAIVLQARRRGDDIVVEIVDSVGIVTSSELANVYETFEHGDPYVRKTGSGLGLALTRSLVELHGGALEIRNDVERGTHAVAHFPIAGPAPIAAKARVVE
nr:sensor histidine kinase [Rhodospirillaceae bacterium]